MYFGVIGGESCLQLVVVLGVLDVVSKSVGKAPPRAGDVALHVSVLSLVIYGYQLRAVLYEIAVLSVLVGRSPGELLASFELGFLAGEELGQLVDGSCLLGVRLRLYSEELAALEGAHLIGLSVDGEGRQLGYSEVVLQNALRGVVIPGTGYYCGSAGAERGYVGILNVALGILQEVHGLGGSESLVGIEVVVDGGELTVGIDGPLGYAAGSEEECRGVPTGVVEVHDEVLTGCFAGGNDLLKALGVLVGDDALVIVHEVAVVGSERISIVCVSRGDGDEGVTVVLSLYLLGCGLTELGYSSGVDQPCQLVLSEEEQVSACLNVLYHGVGCGAFAYCLYGGLYHDAQSVGLVEVIDLLLCEFYCGIGAPYLDLVGTCDLALGFVSVIRRSGVSAVAASGEADHHDEHEHDC